MIRILPPLQIAVALVVLASASAWSSSHAEALGQGTGVLVQRAGADTLIVASGHRASAAFRLTNVGVAAVEVRPRVALPDGWSVAIEPTPLVLAPGEAVLRVVSFVVPAGEAPGVHEVELHTGTTQVSTHPASVKVVVPVTHGLHLEIVDEPVSVAPDEGYMVRLLVGNRGNVSETVRVEVRGAAAGRIRIVPDQLRLAPGAAADVNVEITPVASERSAHLASLRILGSTDHDTVTVISRVRRVSSGRSDERSRGIPGEVRLRARPDDGFGPRVRYSASGPLRPGSRTSADLVLEGPSTGSSVFGDREVYRLRLRNPRFSLVLGDDVHRLSPLTEPGRDGIGVGFSARAGSLEGGGFAQHNRRSAFRDQRAGAFVAYRPLPGVGLRGNWLLARTEGENREVVSGQADLRLPGPIVAQAELGLRPDGGAAARSIDVSATRGAVRLRVSAMDVDSSYGGGQAGLRRETVHLSLRPGGGVTVDGSLDAQKVERTVAGVPFLIDRRSAHVAARWGQWVALEARRLEQASAWTERISGREAESVALSVRLPLGPLHLHSRLEAGEGVERTVAGEPDGDAQGFRRVGAGADLRTGAVSLSSRIERFSGGSLHRLETGDGTSAAASAALRLTASTGLGVSARATRYDTPLERGSQTVTAVAEHRFRNGHGLAFRLDSRSSTGPHTYRRNTAVLDYTLPLRLPVPASRGGATMTGRLHDEISGEPLPGVIIRVGPRSVSTDARGRFEIRGLAPGTYRLDVDPASIPAGLIPGVRLPRVVEVFPRTGAVVDIPFVRPGVLSVETRLAHSTVRGGAIDEEPLAGAILEFRRGEERFRRTTGATGRVVLRELRPGRWKVAVVSANLPAFHRFRETELEMNVSGGDSTVIELVAAPVERRIEMVASAEITAGDDEERVGWTRLRISSPTTLREVARRVYGDPELWVRIRDANAPVLTDVEPLVVGMLLLIPPREGVFEEPSREADLPARPPVPVLARRPPVPAGIPADTVPGTAKERSPAAPRPAIVRAPHTATDRPDPTISITGRDRDLRELARALYGDERLWVRIWLANRQVLPGPDDLYAGMVLRIPPAGPPTAEELRIHEEQGKR